MMTKSKMEEYIRVKIRTLQGAKKIARGGNSPTEAIHQAQIDVLRDVLWHCLGVSCSIVGDWDSPTTRGKEERK